MVSPATREHAAGNPVLDRVPPVALVVASILSVQFGAGIAKTLFDEVAPTTIVWLRLATSAVVLLAIARPALRGRTGRDWRVVVAFGFCTTKREPSRPSK